MLNKLKQFKDLRSQAKTLQNALAEESVSLDKHGVMMTMNGNMELTALVIPDDLLQASKKDKLQETIKDLHKEVLKKIHRTMAMKMKEMGGLPNIPGLS